MTQDYMSEKFDLGMMHGSMPSSIIYTDENHHKMMEKRKKTNRIKNKRAKIARRKNR